MNVPSMERQFARIGARVHVSDALDRWRGGDFAIDVQRDANGEYFDISVRPEADIDMEVVDARKEARHLLLLVRNDGGKEKFLCGHDERHWFAAAIPNRRGVSNVPTAMEALKPVDVIDAQRQHRVRGKKRMARKNRAYVRQGEWFFLPELNLSVKKSEVLRNEPLQRSGSKPHVAEYCYRTGGETVYVCRQYPQGLTEQSYAQLLTRRPKLASLPWTVMRRNPDVYVRGRVRHSDHETIVLHEWHRVRMNTENESRAKRNLTFLD